MSLQPICMEPGADDAPTTRRYARSTLEAFPQTTEYGAAIEAPARRWSVAEALRWIAVLAMFLAVVFSPSWWPQ